MFGYRLGGLDDARFTISFQVSVIGEDQLEEFGQCKPKLYWNTRQQDRVLKKSLGDVACPIETTLRLLAEEKLLWAAKLSEREAL